MNITSCTLNHPNIKRDNNIFPKPATLLDTGNTGRFNSGAGAGGGVPKLRLGTWADTTFRASLTHNEKPPTKLHRTCRHMVWQVTVRVPEEEGTKIVACSNASSSARLACRFSTEPLTKEAVRPSTRGRVSAGTLFTASRRIET